MRRTAIRFHQGDPGEVNGVSAEALLAIIADRLESFRDGGLGGEANEKAIAHVKEAMFHLHQRTTDRILRGVEGTDQP